MHANAKRLGVLALKYHPDRNPGKEQEFNAKFQAIQAAHDILEDPTLRSKYDSDRMRAGMLHTFTSPSPSRPNVPPRNHNTNFPPPPSRAPPSTSKSSFPPPPSGTNRYSTFGRSEAQNSWNGTGAEDAKAKTNHFKAWEQMKHEQGPIPRRNVPPKASTFSAGRDTGSGIPEGSMPKRSGPDRFSDPHADPPGMTRSQTTRLPKKPGFVPATPGADEPQAQRNSAYFNVSSRGERPSAARVHTQVPPPPSRPGATPKKPDLFNAFKSTAGLETHFAKSGRVSTPYATLGGEKTYLSSRLGRSASWREGRRESAWYDGELNDAEQVHPRATSARPNRKQSVSPKMANGSHKPPLSSSSSSSSSSDESVQTGAEGPWRSKNAQRRQARNVTNDNRRPRFKPRVKVEDVEDEDRLRSGHGDGGYGSSGDSRNRQAADQIPRNLSSDYNPEGFMQHRMKREAERQHRQSPQNSAPKAYTPTNHAPPQRPLQRPRSWHNDNGSTESVNGSRSHARASGGENDKAPMYDPFGNHPSFSTPSSNKWSDQWPFNSPKKPRTSTAVPPPYWAIPSSLAPSKQHETRQNLHKYFHSHSSSQPAASNSANTVFPNSFTFPENGTQNSFKPTPPLRSHSSETINLNFSPTEWHGKFTGSTNEYFGRPPPIRGTAARGRLSPTRNRVLRSNQPLPQQANASNEQKTRDESANIPPAPAAAGPPPPPPAQSKYSSEEWAQHFQPATFEFPPPPSGSPARVLSRKRPKAPRKLPKAAYKRQSMPKPASVSAAVDHAEEDPELASVAESLSSKTSGGESAMDIDPASTPPSTGQSQEHGESRPPMQPGLSERTPRPPVPPRAKDFPPDREQDPRINLGELKNVAPFAPSHEGLSNLNDLTSTLPFESRPSKNAAEHSPRQPLVLPNPPKAPPIPVTLTQTSWEWYIAQMRGYMFEWNVYNTKMLNHFNDRQLSVENTLKPEWMSAIGEGTEKWGFKAYMQGVEEDFRVREHWNLSWERHRECMKAFGGARESVLGSSVRV